MLACNLNEHGKPINEREKIENNYNIWILKYDAQYVIAL